MSQKVKNNKKNVLEANCYFCRSCREKTGREGFLSLFLKFWIGVKWFKWDKWDKFFLFDLITIYSQVLRHYQKDFCRELTSIIRTGCHLHQSPAYPLLKCLLSYRPPYPHEIRRDKSSWLYTALERKKFQRSHIISIFLYLFSFLDNSSIDQTLNFLLSLLSWKELVSNKNYIFLEVIIFWEMSVFNILFRRKNVQTCLSHHLF